MPDSVEGMSKRLIQRIERSCYHASFQSLAYIDENTIWAKPSYGLYVLDASGQLKKDYPSDMAAARGEYDTIIKNRIARRFYPSDGSRVYLPYAWSTSIGCYDGSAWSFGATNLNEDAGNVTRPHHLVLQCGDDVLVTTTRGIASLTTGKLLAADSLTHGAVPLGDDAVLMCGERVYYVADGVAREVKFSFGIDLLGCGVRWNDAWVFAAYDGAEVCTLNVGDDLTVQPSRLPNGLRFHSFAIDGHRLLICTDGGLCEWTPAGINVLATIPCRTNAPYPPSYYRDMPLVHCVERAGPHQLLVGSMMGIGVLDETTGTFTWTPRLNH